MPRFGNQSFRDLGKIPPGRKTPNTYKVTAGDKIADATASISGDSKDRISKLASNSASEPFKGADPEIEGIVKLVDILTGSIDGLMQKAAGKSDKGGEKK